MRQQKHAGRDGHLRSIKVAWDVGRTNSRRLPVDLGQAYVQCVLFHNFRVSMFFDGNK